MSEDYDYASEAALERSLEAVATGATRAEAETYIVENFPGLNDSSRARILADAYDDAIAYGVEYEDIDPSWYR